jgi:hypothetical protein
MAASIDHYVGARLLDASGNTVTSVASNRIDWDF